MPIEEDARERLLLTARERARALGSGPPEPGDLFVLRATADLPVEWAVLDRRAEGGELLAVPADVSPFAGSADVEVPAMAPGGPLCLRCRFGAWLDAGLFEPGLRSGALAPETVAEARRQVQQVEAGTLEPSSLAEETDADSEYKDWIREAPERARALALAVRPAVAREPGSGRWEGYRLAAMFAVLAIGLGIWVTALRRDLAAPIVVPLSREVDLGEKTRGVPVLLEVPPGASHIELVLVVDAAVPAQEGRFEINAGGRSVWRSDLMRLAPRDELRVILRRALLPDGEYHIRILPAAGGPALVESSLGIRTAK